MKLAEALSERADIKTRISQLESRLCLNSRVQEGEKPAENPEELLCELHALSARLEELICRINLTNSATVHEGETLTALLARRDVLALELGVLRNFLSEASHTAVRASRSEIKILSTVDVKEKQKQVDSLSKQLRELDIRIQQLNWTVELQ